MAGFSTLSIFHGELDSHTSKDFSKMDYSITKLSERLKYVNEKVDSNYFFVEYFDNHFKVGVNASDPLSEDVNICKILENMANYILNSDEVKEEDERNKPIYVFHKNSENLEAKIKRESISITGINGSTNIVDEENVIHSLVVKNKNYRLPKVQKIVKSDLKEDSLLGEILRDYQVFLDFINLKLQEKPDKNWRYYSNAKHSIQDDMILSKDMLKGVWGYNIQCKESSCPDLDIFDFTDFETVKYMLSMSKPSLSFDYDNWLIWTDFQELLKTVDFTAEEFAVVCCLRDQWKITEIADEMKVDYQRLQRTVVPNVIKKIIKKGNFYDAEDWKTDLKIQKRKGKYNPIFGVKNKKKRLEDAL